VNQAVAMHLVDGYRQLLHHLHFDFDANGNIGVSQLLMAELQHLHNRNAVRYGRCWLLDYCYLVKSVTPLNELTSYLLLLKLIVLAFSNFVIQILQKNPTCHYFFIKFRLAFKNYCLTAYSK
jgi:hypothetical protein